MIINDYNKTVSLIREYLQNRNILIEKFYLFGSRARNDNNTDSDYDFMIVIKNDMLLKDRRAIIGDLYRYLINKKELISMDLIIKTSEKFNYESKLTGYLSNTVLKKGIEI
jgi:predicted nucleotidyltransferase